jgi:hypothetical protein
MNENGSVKAWTLLKMALLTAIENYLGDHQGKGKEVVRKKAGHGDNGIKIKVRSEQRLI